MEPTATAGAVKAGVQQRAAGAAGPTATPHLPPELAAWQFAPTGTHGQLRLSSAGSGSSSSVHGSSATGTMAMPVAGLPPGLATAATPAAIDSAARRLLSVHMLQSLPIQQPPPAQRFWARTLAPAQLSHCEPSPPTRGLATQRSLLTLQPQAFAETEQMDFASSASASTSLRRRPDDSGNIRGSNTNLPFRPGGLDVAEAAADDSSSSSTAKAAAALPTDEAGMDVLLGLDGSAELQTTTSVLGGPGIAAASGGQLARAGVPLPAPIPPGQLRAAGAGAASSTSTPSGGAGGDSISDAAAAAPVALSFASVLFGAGTEDLGQGQTQDESEAANTTAASAPADGEAAATELEAALDASAADAAAAITPSPGQPGDATREWAVMEDAAAPVDDFHELVPDMAYTWPFEPDPFQKRAIIHLERHESVFVAAHTSAGKTVVAEYAIALSARHMTRCIYTSPIKALSNQKFRDFRTTFEDVGLLTGDVQIKPEASCLIMTTEILRSMLYRGADVIRDVEWVIFDEVHYINDAERGVVWEEVIIMLPAHVNIIMLSATVPNTFEFADWVGRTKRKPVYVISTLKRPVPLEHYLFTGNSSKTADELFLLVDARRHMQQAGYRAARQAKEAREKAVDKAYGPRGGGRGGGRSGGGGGGGGARGGNQAADRSMYVAFVNMLKKKDLMPAVVFTFSKKRCEQNADALSSLDLTTSTEKSEIHVFIEQSVNRLQGSDRDLPQVRRMRDLLRRGVGVHHGGLLPIIKEMVEMLFARGLVKVLYATETFAMGVNMPARCVVFDSLRKHDGTNFRDLLPGEYIQMAGRAGRRGLDKTGTVILLCKGDVPELSSLNEMILGRPTKLASRFRLTYNMILNLLRVEELRVEDMMKRSFSEFHMQKDAGASKEELAQSQQLLKKIEVAACPFCERDLSDYYTVSSEVLALSHELQAFLLESRDSAKAFGTGRVVVVNNPLHRNALAVVIRAEASRPGAPKPNSSNKQFSVLVIGEKDRAELHETSPLPVSTLFKPKGPLGFDVKIISGMDIIGVCKKRLKISPLELLERPDANAQARTAQELLQLVEENPEGLELINPVKDFKINQLEFVERWSRLQTLLQQLRSFECTKCPELPEHYGKLHDRRQLSDKISQLQFQLSDESLMLLPEYEQRIEVLRRLRYIDDTNAVQLKGRVACEITTCDEIIATELVFENALSTLTPAEIVALLSCLVFQEKVDVEPNLTPTLQDGVANIRRIAAMVAETQLACGMNTPVDEYLRTLHFGLVEVVYEWANGTPFVEVMELTDRLEGSIVRCIVRLDETCRDVRNSARVIGDPVLYQKMEEASQLIKRDIVFAASLYCV